MNLTKFAPWNWFKSEGREREASRELAHRNNDPNHPLARLHREMDRLFDDFFTSQWPVSLPSFPSLAKGASYLTPVVNISETSKNYTIKVEVPGVEKEDIHIDVQDDLLVIRGEKQDKHEEEGERFHRVECSYGSFQRVINLPPDANAEDIRAKFRNGVLTLTVAKTGEKPASGRTIEVT